MQKVQRSEPYDHSTVVSLSNQPHGLYSDQPPHVQQSFISSPFFHLMASYSILWHLMASYGKRLLAIDRYHENRFKLLLLTFLQINSRPWYPISDIFGSLRSSLLFCFLLFSSVFFCYSALFCFTPRWNKR